MNAFAALMAFPPLTSEAYSTWEKEAKSISTAEERVVFSEYYASTPGEWQ
jgi:hypothetical protein